MGYICVLFQEEDKIKLLADIIEIQSENENEIEVCHYIQNLLAQYDIPSKIIKVSETRANLVAEIGSGSPILAMSGHMDVVDAGHHEKWTYPPFKLIRTGRQIVRTWNDRYERCLDGHGYRTH